LGNTAMAMPKGRETVLITMVSQAASRDREPDPSWSLVGPSGAQSQQQKPKAQRRTNVNDDWSQTVCKDDIIAFGGDRMSMVIRLRVPKVTGNLMVVEFGSPNRPKDREAENAEFELYARDTSEMSRIRLGINKGGWMAVVEDRSSPSPGAVRTKVFHEWLGHCVTPADGGNFTKIDELPTSIRKAFESDWARRDETFSKTTSEAEQFVAAFNKGRSSEPEAKPQKTSDDMAKPGDKEWTTPYHQGRLPMMSKCKGTAQSDFYPADIFTTPAADGSPLFYIGNNEFLQQLNELPVEVRRQWADGVKGNAAWAVYGREGKEFSVQFVYAYGKNCAFYPDKPMRVDVQALSPEVLGRYLSHSNRKVDGTPQEMRDRLVRALNNEAPQTVAEDALASARSMQETYPIPILSKIAELGCGNTADTELEIGDGFMSRNDIDGDGDVDWITDGQQLVCIDKKNGRRQIVGGGNGGTDVWIVVSTPTGPVMAADMFVKRATIKRHSGFATVEYIDDTGSKQAQIRGGKMIPINRVPPGGEVVFDFYM